MWKDDEELEKYLAEFQPREVRPLAMLPAWTQVSARSFRSVATATMRIPRFAFVLMLAAILSLSAGLVALRARANAGGPVLWLEVKLPDGKVFHSALATNGPPGSDAAGFGTNSTEAMLSVTARFLCREVDRVELGVKARYENPKPGFATDLNERLKGIAEQNIWIEPGKNTEISVPDLGTVEFAGDFIDHKPPSFFSPEDTVDPKGDEFRIVSPVLVRGKEVAFNFGGASSTTSNGSGAGVFVYWPGEGRFLFSAAPFKDAVKGSVFESQVKFRVDGQDYVLLTAVPATRAANVWVRHEQSYKPSEQDPGINDNVGMLAVGGRTDFPEE